MRNKFIGILVFFFLLSSMAFARTIETDDITDSSDSVNITLDGTNAVASVYHTKSFFINKGEYFATAYKVNSVSGSLVNVTIQLQQSWTPPTTEGLADANWTIPVSQSDIATNLTTENTWYIKALSPISFVYARYKITANAITASDTIVNLKISKSIDN